MRCHWCLLPRPLVSCSEVGDVGRSRRAQTQRKFSPRDKLRGPTSAGLGRGDAAISKGGPQGAVPMSMSARGQGTWGGGAGGVEHSWGQVP